MRLVSRRGRVRVSAKSYYHGSNESDIDRLQANDEQWSLLGTGIYFYAKESSARTKGRYVYKIVPKGLKIAPKNFKFDDKDIEVIASRLGIEGQTGKYIGESDFIWWATDGWNMFDVLPFFKKRKNLVALLSKYMMQRKGFDGMLADYPNGGEVLVLWDGYRGLKPEIV